ncbi:MAG: hypothetical protein AAB074_23495, partial [Planctomycetota bacterium]
MRPALSLCLAALAGCTYPDPDLRPAPPRRAAFGEAASACYPNEVECSRVTIVSTAWAWETPEGWRIHDIDVIQGECQFGETRPAGYGLLRPGALEPSLALRGDMIAWTETSSSDHKVVAYQQAGAVSSFASLVTGTTPFSISPQDVDARRPSCDPGSRFVAWEEVLGSKSRLWTTDVVSARQTFVTDGGAPAWSPDGQWIAFESGAPPSIYKV